MPKEVIPFPLNPDKYQFGRLLGSGSYGTVQAWQDRRNGKCFAVKRIGNTFDDFLITRRTLREIRLMRHFRCSYIIGIVDVFMKESEKPDPEKIEKNRLLGYSAHKRDLYLLSELMDYDLDQMIRSRKEITSKHVKSFTQQILLGLKYLHAAHVIHRDLKPANIFVRKDGSVKLGDLGLARQITLDANGHPMYPSEENLTEYVVTRWYRAPEILVLRGCYGPACDVWSVGCILYEMVNREVLLQGKGGYDQVFKMLQVTGVYPDVSWLDNTVERQHEKASNGERIYKITKIEKAAGDHAKGVIEKISNDVLNAIPRAYSHRDPSTYPCMSARYRIAGMRDNFVPIVLPTKNHQRIPSMTRDLIEKMMQFNPETRVSIDESLRHPLFGDLREVMARENGEVAKVRPIDMGYDQYYDEKASDSKNIPLEYRTKLAVQLCDEVDGWAYERERNEQRRMRKIQEQKELQEQHARRQEEIAEVQRRSEERLYAEQQAQSSGSTNSRPTSSSSSERSSSSSHSVSKQFKRPSPTNSDASTTVSRDHSRHNSLMSVPDMSSSRQNTRHNSIASDATSSQGLGTRVFTSFLRKSSNGSAGGAGAAGAGHSGAEGSGGGGSFLDVNGVPGTSSVIQNNAGTSSSVATNPQQRPLTKMEQAANFLGFGNKNQSSGGSFSINDTSVSDQLIKRNIDGMSRINVNHPGGPGQSGQNYTYDGSSQYKNPSEIKQFDEWKSQNHLGENRRRM